MALVELTNLTVIYPNKDGDRTALNEISLTIGSESIALLGPNGAGKSTLMGVLAGTQRPTSGSLHRADSTSNTLGMVFQTPALDELLTVRENLSLSGALHGMSKDLISTATTKMAESLGITDRLDQQVRHLSGGLKRRADLARALMPEPRLLILDEPTTGLDVEARVSLWSAIDSIRTQRKMSVVYATHMTEEARRADRVVLLCEGTIVIDGPPDQLRNELGSQILRIKATDAKHAQLIERWASEIGSRAMVRDLEVIISDVQPQHAGQCPGNPVQVTLSSPTLEDVYLWHSGSAFGGESS